ncbi:MAG: phosphatidylserine/phosphatidylglycerophosphate/cardiolipin synthase family protein [Candidatus Riflebacteria bacterium]|nr:phosphatidylserine/phosphatidylglycerophosphate/cardiolipin synthase family protein [Candidatus Riflebacteria bacterium]
MKVRIRSLLSVAVLVCALLAGVTAGAETFTPAPLNPELKAVFDSINVGSEDTMTQVRLITDNDKAWYVRWKMIESAKKTIDTTYFMMTDDVFGFSFLGLLRKRALEGIKIRLMIDGRVRLWAPGTNDVLQDLAALPNVEIKYYNDIPKQFLSLFHDLKRILASNHDKIIIIDGKYTIIGGRNIGADYFVQPGEYKIVYHDSDILMNGSHVAGRLKLAFDEEWGFLKNSIVKPDLINIKNRNEKMDLACRAMYKYMNGRGFYSDKDEKLTEEGKKLLTELNKELGLYKNISSYAGFELFYGDRARETKIIDKHSCVGVRNDISSTLIKIIDATKHSILIQNPYVVLSPEATNAIIRASARGVKIILHTNSAASSDNIFPQAFFMNDWKNLLKDAPNCRLLIAKGAEDRLHSKKFVFDGQLTIVGTYNLDPLSDAVNSEVVAAVYGREFATMTAKRIEKDYSTSLEYKIEVQRDTGEVKAVFGPEDHINADVIKKMNKLRKLQWLRPLI